MKVYATTARRDTILADMISPMKGVVAIINHSALYILAIMHRRIGKETQATNARQRIKAAGTIKLYEFVASKLNF